METRDLFPVKFEAEYYDVNKFLRDHPGGVGTLRNFKGKCILKAMEKFEHSSGAYHMLKDFRVDSDVLKDANLTGAVTGNGRIITTEEATRDVKEIAFLEELESRLDWSKPLLEQLDAIAPHYERWVNSAVFRKCRLFANPLLESMTFTPWYLVPLFWVPIIMYLAITQYIEQVQCTGAVRRSAASVPARTSVCIGFGSILSIAAVPVVFKNQTCRWTYCFVEGYLTYDMIHYYIHHGSPRDGTYLYAMKRYHSNHHFINYDKAFGISSKLWDYVFRTCVRVKKLSFSLHW